MLQNVRFYSGRSGVMRATQVKRRSPERGAAALRSSIVAFVVALTGTSCMWHANDGSGKPPSPEAIGNREHGREVISRVGCGSCHDIPGVAQAEGSVGPPLQGIATRSYVGGALPNVPDNMVAWIQHPKKIDPATAMPDLGLTDAEARDVAAYLYTLK